MAPLIPKTTLQVHQQLEKKTLIAKKTFEMQFSPSTQRQQSPERRLSPERRQEILKSRIPQPTFHSARRSVHESIRAVRYNPMDRLAASLDAGQVNSSSNWSFKADSSFSK